MNSFLKESPPRYELDTTKSDALNSKPKPQPKKFKPKEKDIFKNFI